MSRSKIILLGALWLTLLALGLGGLARYASAPGAVGETPDTLPAALVAALPEADSQTNGWRLLVAVHPKCPCTTATVRMLEETLGRSTDQPELIALVRTPADADPQSWMTGVSVDHLRKMGATLITDPDAALGASIGAETSGHAVLVDQTNTVRFSGGLTPTRGHTGPSTGSESMLALLSDQSPAAKTSEVYGCPLGCDAHQAPAFESTRSQTDTTTALGETTR